MKKIHILIIMSLMIFLSSSSFFLPSYLKEKIALKEVSTFQLKFARKLKIESALKYQLNTYQTGSEQWLTTIKILANTDYEAAFNLGQYFQKTQRLNKATFWYLHAIRLGSQPASYSLAQLYYQQGESALAIPLLQTSIPKEQALTLRLTIAIEQGEINVIQQLLALFEEKLSNDISISSASMELLTLIEKYAVSPTFILKQTSSLSHSLAGSRLNEPSLNASINADLISNQHCKNQVQIYATSIEDLVYSEKLINKFKGHSLNQYFCFSAPKYIPLPELNCRHQAEQTINCEEKIWQKKVLMDDTKYLMVLLPEGGANVHFGIMYLDNKDDELVLAHELAHFLGFIDEYKLAKEHKLCAQNQSQPFSNNIAIIQTQYSGERKALRAQILAEIPWAAYIKENTPILTKGQFNWRLGTPLEFADEIGIFPTLTCDQRLTEAFRPVSKRNLMEYFEAEFPESYQKILLKNKGKYQMPSFHYNVALALFNAGDEDEDEAKQWLKRASLFEASEKRKIKVLAGDF